MGKKENPNIEMQLLEKNFNSGMEDGEMHHTNLSGYIFKANVFSDDTQ